MARAPRLLLRACLALALAAPAAAQPQATPSGAIAIPPPAARPARTPEPPEARACAPDGRGCIREARYLQDVCATIQTAAQGAGLDAGFFARLLWQESLFAPRAVSPAGAQGIAQFMPGTAALRGLADPFNPAAAIFASADYLGELTERYGNPGLAAAAYNAGEDRLDRYVATPSALLPVETLGYVSIITGHSPRDWRDAPPESVDFALDPGTPFLQACEAQASSRRFKVFADPIPPWGVVIATAARRGMAERLAFRIRRAHPTQLAAADLRLIRAPIPGRGTRLWHTVQIPAQSRGEALRSCMSLRRSGAICRIQRN